MSRTRTRHSQAYARLAVAAGKKGGMAAPSPRKVADDLPAREIRDGLWGQYERMLRDEQTFTLADIRTWLIGQEVKVGSSSIHRDRVALLLRQHAIVLAAGRAKAVMQAAQAAGIENLGQANMALAQQQIFETLTELPPEAMTGMEPADVIRMMELGGKLVKVERESALMDAKLTDLRKRFEAAAKTARAKTGGKLTQKDVEEIGDTVFGRRSA